MYGWRYEAASVQELNRLGLTSWITEKQECYEKDI